MTARRAALVAGLLAVAVAAPSIRNGFVADDRWVIAERPLLQHPPSLGAVLQEPYWPAGFGGALWRPIVLASYALDYRLSGSPHWFHAVNVLWAGLAAALLALLACRLSDPVTGLVAGLLFAVHPVHVEAVANVVGRAELMAAAGYATALLCALEVARRPVYAIGVALGVAFAIGCKELAATLPAAVILIYVGRGSGVRAALRPAAVALLPILGYYVVHEWVGAGILSAGGTATGLERLGIVQRTWAMLALSVEWWRLLLWPAHLSADYSPGDVVPSTGLTAAHLAGALVWAGAGWAAWRWRKTVPGIAIGLVWMIVTVSPVANIVVPTELLVAERTLYLPSFGIAFALASVGTALWSSWPARRQALRAIGLVALVAGAARSVARVSVWHDDETHFQALKRDAPHSYRTLWMVAKDEFQAGRWGSGERLLREAIALAPAIAGPRFDLARFYWDAGLWRPAAEQLTATTAVDSAFVPAWILLPRALLAAGDTVRARIAAREAVRLFPDDPDVVKSATAVLTTAQRH